MLKKVLVPLDGSDLSYRAVEYARQILEPNGCITLVTVVDLPDYPGMSYYPVGVVSYEMRADELYERMLPQANKYLSGIADTLREAGYGVEIVALTGDPAAVIVEEAEKSNVDAIVMSTHGRSGISRWLLGSVTHKVLNATHRPMFIVPSKN
jgi:nucleotide-binding universal stress UspA family protein